MSCAPRPTELSLEFWLLDAISASSPTSPLARPLKAKGKKKMETFSSLSLLPSSPAFHSSKTSSLIFSHGFLPSLLGRHSRPAATVTPPLPRARGGGMVMASSAVSRRTLSEGWDQSAPVSGSAWMPRFDELDTTNMLLKQRIVFLGSQVDDMTADLIVNQLLFLDAEDEKKDIKLFINSLGGSVTVFFVVKMASSGGSGSAARSSNAQSTNRRRNGDI